MLTFAKQSDERLSRLRTIRALYRERQARETPEARGIRVLRSWLSLEQRSEFDECGYFHVVGCVTGKKYRIYPGSYANVQEIGEDGTPNASLCFLPKGR